MENANLGPLLQVSLASKSGPSTMRATFRHGLIESAARTQPRSLMQEMAESKTNLAAPDVMKINIHNLHYWTFVFMIASGL